MTNDLATQVEALLFVLGRPVTKRELCDKLDVEEAELSEALAALHDLPEEQSRGIVLVDDGKSVELRATPAAAELIEKVRREEYSRDIGRAGFEALAAILYRGPLTRAEIDFIRGVNSQQTLRTLTMRGLVRRVANPRDERSFLYEPTTELLSQLGITEHRELPEYEAVRGKLAALEEAYRAKQTESDA